MIALAVPWQAAAGGLRIRMRLTPRASADRIDGVVTLSDGSAVLAARVRALPSGGAANEALRRLLATSLGVPAGAVTVVAGAGARIKTVAVAGDAAALAERLQGAVAAG